MLAPHGGEVYTSSDPAKDKLSYGSPLQATEGSSSKPLLSSSGPEMKRIHLDPSLCLPLTPVT